MALWPTDATDVRARSRSPGYPGRNGGAGRREEAESRRRQLLRVEGAAGAGRALLQMPLGASQDAQGRSAARQPRRDEEGRRHGPGDRPRRSRGQPDGPGGAVQGRAVRMPPKGKLPDGDDRRARAVGPGRGRHAARAEADARPTSRRSPPGIDFEAARSHWAYQPIRQPGDPGGPPDGLAEIADRCLRAGQAGGRRADPVAARRSSHPAPPRLLTT